MREVPAATIMLAPQVSANSQESTGVGQRARGLTADAGRCRLPVLDAGFHADEVAGWTLRRVSVPIGGHDRTAAHPHSNWVFRDSSG